MSVTFAVSTDSETCNGFSIADPNDPSMLDGVGFDSAAPQLVSDFARGAL
jgi:60 kDa SS-A/Ro ribonucleoprotein